MDDAQLQAIVSEAVEKKVLALVQKMADEGVSFDQMNAVVLPRLVPIINMVRKKVLHDTRLMLDPSAPSLTSIH